MRINDDFSLRACVHADAIDWVPSPMAGVERKMLDRVGGEVARATSIVRYAPGSRFSPHVHGGGEEFIVLDGVFQDEHGDYPAGRYVRNPPQSRHTPGSAAGCTIFVKLWQFDAADRHFVNRNLFDAEQKPAGGREGVTASDIFHDDRESVRVERWRAGAHIALAPEGGLEIFCLDGDFSEGGETFRKHSWLRLPQNAALDARAGAGGCLVWVKEGHLRFVDADLAAIAST
ncbi:cupin domain-containing protein [Parvibaculum sp.]|uniref:cupin domain-containing protein n=1 Tax=Parvibaculum sp. TaxID=2024848 RepID=UPI001B2EE484|nr:cupin domain-containing protein [Parvibaculum sp.]MBO6634772.1 cupin domain-containing protein [Parvibaculum sp.]MBO6677913.1 cupin domain-containing protein [Parvibaculum sp.]MBO6683387.1 cupin domain-containing protein [Parvibaculum sp.]MBO6906486.1 cupin domain-containing protein [Parvibaculum sp.]